MTNPLSIRLADWLAWTNGEASGPLPETCSGVTQDTRTLKPGELYVALRGARLDGHAFIGQAFARGAAAAMAAADWPVPDTLRAAPIIRVADPLAALAAAARAWRGQCPARVIGLTGSSGKTTTREFTAAFLRATGHSVCATPGNRNNAVGLPLSLLTLTPETDFGVFETGTNHPGEIAALAAILHPDAAILTNIGTAHIERFGTRAAIAREKGALFEALPETGFAVLPRETICFDALARRTRARVITVSLRDPEADFRGEPLDLFSGRIRVTERASGAVAELRSGLPGEHHALDLLLAFAAARTMGIPAEACPAALRSFRLPGMHWALSEQNGVTFINDAYNANPGSMAAALQTFAARPCPGRRVAVLGDMLELGEHAGPLHRAIGRLAARSGLDRLVTVGPLTRRFLADGAVRAGFPAARIFSFDDVAGAAAARETLFHPGDTVLLKASRGIALERLL